MDHDYVYTATVAYEQCCNWFGKPEDYHWSYTLQRFARSGCVRSTLYKEYIIAVNKSYKYPEQIKATLCREMYYRVTMTRNTIRKHPWLDEVLATLTKYHCMVVLGYPDYANYSLHYDTANDVMLKPKQLKRIRRRRLCSWFTKDGFPSGYGITIRKLAIKALENLTWDTMRRAVNSASFEDWLNNIEQSERNTVVNLFGEYFV